MDNVPYKYHIIYRLLNSDVHYIWLHAYMKCFSIELILTMTLVLLDRKKIIAVIDRTFAVMKRKPEKTSGLYGIRTL